MTTELIALVEEENGASSAQEHEEQSLAPVVEELEQVEEQVDAAEEEISEELHTKQEEADEENELPTEFKALKKRMEDKTQKRIDKLTREKKEAQENAERLRAQLAQLNIEQVHGNDEFFIDPQTNLRVDKPKATTYANNSAAYLEDMYKYSQKKDNATRVIQSHQQFQFKQQEVQASYELQVEDIKKKYPDFKDAVQSQEMLRFQNENKVAVEILMRNSKGAEIAYYLAKTPGVLTEMLDYLPKAQDGRMDPIAFAQEIGEIKAIIEMAEKPKVVSSAPKPLKIKPNGQTKTVTGTNDYSKLTPAEWRERLKKK